MAFSIVGTSFASGTSFVCMPGRLPQQETEIGPFRVDMPDEALADLRRRLAATRSPSKELVPDRSQGVQLATIQGAGPLNVRARPSSIKRDRDRRITSTGERA